MAKTNEEKIDEKAIVASFLDDDEAADPVLADKPVETKNSVSGSSSTPKEESRKRKGKLSEYEETFIKDSPVTARTGKIVYIRKDFHDTILNIIRVIGMNEVSISGYLDNVINHHLETYKEEINTLYNKKHTGVFSNK